MNLDKYKQYAPALVRVTISLVFLWFGLNQILDTSSWLQWLPAWAYQLPLSPTAVLVLNGSFETVFGLLLLVGLFTRITALLLSLHLLGIAWTIGYNDVGIRDLGLALVTFSIFLSGSDRWSLDTKRKKHVRV